MKIYNKRGFFQGVFYLCFAVLAMILMIYKGMNLRDWFLVVLGVSLGIYYISRSLSKNASMADRDELSEHLRIKTKALAFSWVRGICIGLWAFFAMLFSHTKSDIHMALFICFGFMIIVMVTAEAIIELVCNRKVE